MIEKALLLLVIIGLALIAGCVQEAPQGSTENTTNLTNQPSGIPRPGDEDVKKGEEPQFPF